MQYTSVLHRQCCRVQCEELAEVGKSCSSAEVEISALNQNQDNRDKGLEVEAPRLFMYAYRSSQRDKPLQGAGLR